MITRFPLKAQIEILFIMCCLNLNRVLSPVLLGVDPAGLEGRFSFVSGTAELDETNPWESLDTILPGGVVPAIADQTVIQWGLGKKAGLQCNIAGEFEALGKELRSKAEKRESEEREAKKTEERRSEQRGADP